MFPRRITCLLFGFLDSKAVLVAMIFLQASWRNAFRRLALLVHPVCALATDCPMELVYIACCVVWLPDLSCFLCLRSPQVQTCDDLCLRGYAKPIAGQESRG